MLHKHDKQLKDLANLYTESFHEDGNVSASNSMTFDIAELEGKNIKELGMWAMDELLQMMKDSDPSLQEIDDVIDSETVDGFDEFEDSEEQIADPVPSKPLGLSDPDYDPLSTLDADPELNIGEDGDLDDVLKAYGFNFDKNGKISGSPSDALGFDEIYDTLDELEDDELEDDEY